MHFGILLVLNVASFIIARYLSLLLAFLMGMGAADHYKYESYVYLPGTALQLIFLVNIFIIKYKKQGFTFGSYRFLIIASIICFLSVAGSINIIPYRFIPY